MMKVLMLSPLPPPVGGISRWTQLVLAQLQHKPDVSIRHINIAPRFSGPVTRMKRIFWGLVGVLSICAKVCRSLKDKPDVLHMTSSGSFALWRDRLILKLAKRRHVPAVYHLHYGRVPAIVEENASEWKLLRSVLDDCSFIIAIDEKTLAALSAQGYGEKLSFVPNPVDTAYLQEKIIPFSQREKKVAYLGHILREKGMEELLEAWKEIFCAFPSYRLELIGAPYREDYLRSLPLSESVHLAGQKDHAEAMALLSTASLFVLPSYREGFPNVILEAMALKVPIVATAVGAIPQMLADGCGCVIADHSASEIRDAVEKLLANPTEGTAMADRAYERVNKRYSTPVVVDQYCAIWERAVNNCDKESNIYAEKDDYLYSR